MNNMRERRFRVGDVIEVEGVLAGTVESIDLRSTLIRGYDQTPRYVPNADLSNAVVLNFSHGKSRRIWVSVPLVLSSRRAQIIAIRDGLRDYLANSGDFDISADAPQHVYVEALSDSAVPIIFYARTNVASYANYLQVHERLSLKVLELVELVGTDLAYPTQTLNVDKMPAPDLNGPTAP
jgi:MscS family membrane protein